MNIDNKDLIRLRSVLSSFVMAYPNDNDCEFMREFIRKTDSVEIISERPISIGTVVTIAKRNVFSMYDDKSNPEYVVVKQKKVNGNTLHGLMRLMDIMCQKYGDGCKWKIAPWRYFQAVNLRAERRLKDSERKAFEASLKKEATTDLGTRYSLPIFMAPNFPSRINLTMYFFGIFNILATSSTEKTSS